MPEDWRKCFIVPIFRGKEHVQCEFEEMRTKKEMVR